MLSWCTEQHCVVHAAGRHAAGGMRRPHRLIAAAAQGRRPACIAAVRHHMRSPGTKEQAFRSRALFHTLLNFAASLPSADDMQELEHHH